MANIRIKDLANTASSTASDDFIAVDGATNGTRKLNAYSPSFGGNATVAGTLGVGPSSTLGTVNITTPNLTYGTVYLNGATTGADFMRLKSSGADGVFGIESSVGSAILSGSSANATVLYSVGSNPLQFGTAGTVKGTLTSGGNLLIGTTTDSANGKLQLADHTTSAGGIGFGTDISLYRVNPNSFKIGLSAANFTLDAGGSGTGGARIVGGGGLTLTSNTGESLYLQSGGLVGITINSSQQVHVNATTASTSTSTGALTVGGGVGVAGAIYAGGNLVIGSTSQITNTASVASGTRLTLNTEAQQGIDIFRSDANANFSGIRFRNSANSATNAQIGWNGTTLRVDAATVEIPGTTASTSTSTGALVVSGGVGVAGAINAGTLGLNGSTSGAVLNVKETAGVATAVSLTNRNSTQTWSVAVDAAAVDDKLLAFISGGSVIASLNPTDQSATFAGSVKTAAPAGGTAANWKLGTVATVSPTSPNRTIEVDIGGTIYYIHAKTTNN